MAKHQDVLAQEHDQQQARKERLAQERDQASQQQNTESQEPKQMPEYTATRKVRAFRVKSVDRNPNSTITLLPEDSAFDKVQLGGKQAEAIPGWNPSTPNSDPGYAVIDENGNRYWMSTQEFESLFGQNKEAKDQQAK